MARKILGKFNALYESNLRLRYLGGDVGTILRRPNPAGERDVLDVSIDDKAVLDRRVAVAVALLALGAEP
jgi:hypothetical protein